MRTVRLGTPRVHLRLTDSTNSRARELAAAGGPDGTLVTAAEQSAGRGRQGRTWSAPPNTALLCSLVVREPPQLLSLIAGVAVAATVDRVTPPSRPGAVIKWPNDVLVEGLKVAGILVEGRPQEGWAVLGIGLNVSVSLTELPAGAARQRRDARPGADLDRAGPGRVARAARRLASGAGRGDPGGAEEARRATRA